MSKLTKIMIGLAALIAFLLALSWWLVSGNEAEYTMAEVTGTDPVIAEPIDEMIPTVSVAKPIGWAEGEVPEAAEGLHVSRFASGLEHPRVIYTMPGGDVIVAESNAPGRISAGGGAITNFIAGILFERAGAAVPSPNKLILLRDADGDGVAEERHTLRDDLASPSGLAWLDGKLYVANHNALLRFDYEEGANVLSGEPEKLMDLPPAGNHWMRNIVIHPDGDRLYVAVGSASNIGEGGMEIEQNRAAIHEYNLETGRARIYGDGLRNPNGLDFNPWSGEMWVTVNERDMLGSDLVPDYLTNVPIGVSYGWPWVYWNEEIDERVEPPMPNFHTEYTRTPEFALGPHVAPLGLAFTREGTIMGDGFSHGAFIARHGSWNRKPPSGYDVVYVAFDDRGNPIGKPVPVLKSFLAGSGETRGRPTWVAWDKSGALLVSDDTANIIWRVSMPGAAPTGAQILNQGKPLPPQRELHGDPARAFEHPPVGMMPGMMP